ncbi:MAG: metal ABC transporter ATP-binding protein [Acutalibacteraceae bacterium]
MAVVEFQNVSVGYDGKAVTTGLDFSVPDGAYLSIVGENGAGKSTTMKTLLGLKKPIDGKIVFGDGLKSNEIGYLPQQTQVQRDFPATVSEVVLSGCLNQLGFKPFYSKEQKQTAKKWMDRLEITEISKRSYKQLSGGQQQRVLLARALSATKKLIVLDEPVSGLDPVVTENMYELIRQINREDKITVIMVSHDLAAAIRYSTHILQISDKMLFFGTTEQYKESDVGRRFIGKAGDSDA